MLCHIFYVVHQGKVIEILVGFWAVLQRWLLKTPSVRSIEKCTLSRNQLSMMININVRVCVRVYVCLCVCA